MTSQLTDLHLREIDGELNTANDGSNVITITVGGASAQSDALTAGTVYDIATDTDCYIAFGSNPVAAADTGYLPADTRIKMRANSAIKMAALQVTGAGTVWITPLAGYRV